MAGMTENGWEHRRLPQVIDSLNNKADELFRPLLEDPDDVVDVSADSMLGRFINLVSPEYASMWEAALDCYSGLDPDQAYGRGLDALVEYGAITRREAVKSTVLLEIGGIVGESIPSNSSVKDKANNNIWVLPKAVTFASESATSITYKINTYSDATTYSILVVLESGSFTFEYTSVLGNTEIDVLNGLKANIELQTPLFDVVVDPVELNITISIIDKSTKLFWTAYNGYVSYVKQLAQALSLETGNVVSQIGNITIIENPVFGWDFVTNPFPVVAGYSRETDSELRKRFKDSKALRSEGYADSMYSAVSQVAGVKQVIVYENYEDSVQPITNLPPKSFMVVAIGGANQDIANSIRIERPLGILSQGNTVVDFFDKQGLPVTERIERPVYKEIYFKIQYKKVGTVEFNVESKIKQSLVDYINNDKKIAEVLRYDELFAPLMTVKGITYKLINFGLSDVTVGYSEITPDFNEVVFTKLSNIEVEEV